MERAYSNPDTIAPETFDLDAQQAARDAIMEIDLFPDLTVALRRALGYGPHVEMLQHLTYWFSPRRHPKMQRRWTLYKTYAEWWDECGLSRRQVERGRRALQERGLVSEKKGPRGIIHYRPDWVAIAQTLNLEFRMPGYGEHSEDFDDLHDWVEDENCTGEDDSECPPTVGTVRMPAYGGHARMPAYGGHAISEEYVRREQAGEPLLQSGAEPAVAEPAPRARNGKPHQEQDAEAGVSDDKRRSQDGLTPSETTAKKAAHSPPKPDNDALLSEVRQALDPDSGVWWGAASIAARPERYTPETATRHMSGNPDLPERIREIDQEALLPVVRYVLWERRSDSEAA